MPLLLPLLKHASPLVREGAIYGLAKHDGADGVREEFERLATKDPSAGVRAVAAAALEEM